MRAVGGGRTEWREIPGEVRSAIEGIIGSPVVEAVNQVGGFSPGLAARCRLADGGRAFVKAVSPEQNPHSCRIHRREIEVASQLPAWVPAPRLRGWHDDGTWVGLVFDEVDGRQPTEPWTWADLDVVVPAVVDLGRRADPCPVDGLPTVVDRHAAVFDGWRRLAAGDGPVDQVPPWARDRLDTMAVWEAGWPSAASGTALLHADIRADNVLIGEDGSVTFVDWPWACAGAAFVDLVFMLPSIGLGDGPPVVAVVDHHSLFADVDDDALVAVLAAVAGFFLRASFDPDPPGLPTLRSFQRAQAHVALGWLREQVR